MKSVEALIAELKHGSVTSEALVTACFDAISERDGEIQAFLRTDRDEALALARESDARRAIGQAKSDIDGLPVAIKDNFSYAGHITSASSKMLEHYEAPYDATVVTKLRAAGAIIIGQTNMDEFAMGSSGENSAYQKTKNPYDTNRVPGGSSSGAAAAVAADMVPLSFGSDTGGSIRQPAAFCGVVGLKPTYGAVSRYGLLAMASSLDQIGPLAQTVAGVRIGFEAVRGQDANDSTSKEAAYLSTKPLYRIGIPKQFMGDGLDERVRSQIEAAAVILESQGHTIVRDIDIPLMEQSVAIYYVLMPAEVSSNLARYDGIRFGVHGDSVASSRSTGFGPEVKRRIMLGTFALSAGYADKFYKRAQAARAALAQEMVTALEQVDVLLGPVTPGLPFKFGEKSSDPLAMYLSDIYTIPVNLAGVPAISIPGSMVEEGGVPLPVGIQLIGKHWGEYQLFDLAEHLETQLRRAS